MTALSSSRSPAFQAMVKPVGPICNLDCTYCYYLEKESLYPESRDFRMAPEVLEAFVKQYIDAQPEGPVQFAWQGLGADFLIELAQMELEPAVDDGICTTSRHPAARTWRRRVSFSVGSSSCRCRWNRRRFVCASTAKVSRAQS